MFDAPTQAQILIIAKRLNVPTAALLAVAEVESGGRTLAKVKGRFEPLIRFEGHYFDRMLKGKDRQQARNAGLASPRAGGVKNPRSQTNRWKLLRRAMKINRAAALSSISWGLGQVMGSHWKWLGYRDIEELVETARSGIAGQVELMARFIDKSGLDDALRKQDWPKFARRYNGPAYAKNRYDIKMARAFARYKGQHKKSLPQVQKSAHRPDQLLFGARGAKVKELQKALSANGYPLVADGLFGLITDKVVRQFQRDHKIKETGIIGAKESRILFARQSNLQVRHTREKPAKRTSNQMKRRKNSRGLLFGRMKAALLSIFRRIA